MQHLEGSGTSVLYLGRTFLKVNHPFQRKRDHSTALHALLLLMPVAYRRVGLNSHSSFVVHFAHRTT
jgi:hypothetical protein